MGVRVGPDVRRFGLGRLQVGDVGARRAQDRRGDCRDGTGLGLVEALTASTGVPEGRMVVVVVSNHGQDRVALETGLKTASCLLATGLNPSTAFEAEARKLGSWIWCCRTGSQFNVTKSLRSDSAYRRSTKRFVSRRGVVTMGRFMTPNDQDHRARGPMRINVEQPESVNEGEDVEKAKDKRAWVGRLVRPRLSFQSSTGMHSSDSMKCTCASSVFVNSTGCTGDPNRACRSLNNGRSSA